MSTTPGKYVRYRAASRVISVSFSTCACAPIQKIRQRRAACATRAAILKKRLRREPPGLIGQGRPTKYAGVEPPIKLACIRECRCEFRVDERIDEHRPASRRRSELFLRPCHPRRVGGRDVEQHVCVDEKPVHASPRVRPITSSVVAPVLAAPAHLPAISPPRLGRLRLRSSPAETARNPSPRCASPQAVARRC